MYKWVVYESLLMFRHYLLYSTNLRMINCFQCLMFLVFQQETLQPIQILATSVMLPLVIIQDPLVQGTASTLAEVRREEIYWSRRTQ